MPKQHFAVCFISMLDLLQLCCLSDIVTQCHECVVQELVNLNAPKVHEKWRTLMRKAKTEELKQDIQWLSDAQQSTLERKDNLIQVCYVSRGLQASPMIIREDQV